MASVPLSDLRARIAALEGRAGGGVWGRAGEESRSRSASDAELRSVRFGLDIVERLFPLEARPEGTVHDLAAAGHRDAGALSGVAVAVLARMGRAAGPIIWVCDAVTAGEIGALYGPGLAAFGIDPARLVLVTAKSGADALWAAEEALSVSQLAAVVVEIGGASRLLDLTATRRLALRAERQDTPVFLLRPAGPDTASAARTRWRIAPRPSTPDPYGLAGLGRPGFALQLTRNRGGPTGAVDVEFRPYDHRFRPAHPLPVAAPASDRSARPGPAMVIALPRAS
ncbi:ImuA family protein [Amorphus sp. 3PC139-8]|uniref:ImuA family protein n=1 Tax=Amorphus sp. 3PC139-8 TaxID=2735676 RepID=UPI00345DC751